MAITLPRQASNMALPISIAVMDACYIFTAAWLFEHSLLYRLLPFEVPNPLFLTLLELTALWLVGQTLLNRVGGNLLRTTTGLIGLLVSLGLLAALNFPAGGFSGDWLLKAAFPLIPCVGIWMLGSYRSTKEANFAAAYRTFILGLLVMALLILLTGIVTNSQSPGMLNTLALVPVVFFAAALAALALGNREMIRQETGSGSGPFWGVISAASIGGVLLVSLLGGAVNLPDILDVGAKVLGFLLLAVALLLYQILYWVFLLWSRIFPIELPAGDARNVRQAGPAMDPLAHLRKMMEGGKPGEMPLELQGILMWTAGIVIGTIVVVALIVGSRMLTRNRPPSVRDVPEERERFGSWALVKERFVQWWRTLLARFRPQQAPSTAIQADELAAMRGNPDWSGTLSVRQIYAHMQSLAARRGYPRAPQQTPAEYLAVLSRAMPHLRADLAGITSAYTEARYGPLPASAPAVLAATEAWKRAEAILKRET